MEATEHFAALVDAYVGRPGIAVPGESGRRSFGSSALKVNGSIFAMLTGDHLVVKLPRDRVDALIADGTGGPFDAGKGKPMKEWLTVLRDDDETWTALTEEAFAFVASRSVRR